MTETQLYDALKLATAAAEELAQNLTLEQLQKVSKPTAKWIAEHFRLEKKS